MFGGKRTILIIFLLAILIRFINITMPILEGTANRQVQTAMMARNFFREGFNILYPRVDFMGKEPGYMLLEFPILPFLAGLGYKLIGGVQEWLGRLVVIGFFSGSLLFLYGIARRLFNERVAIWAMLVYSFSPLSIIFSRTFMPDFIMLFFCTASLYFMYRYCQEGITSKFWLCCISSAFALLSKPQSFYIAVPLVYLLWQKERARMFILFKNWLFLVIAALPAFLWYTHAGDIMRQVSLSEAYNYEFWHWFKPGLFLGKELYIALINIYSGIFLTPIGLTLFIGGLFLKTEKDKGLLWAWFFGVIIFMVIFNTHIDDPYYNLSMLPVASIFIARMIEFLRGLDWENKTLLRAKTAKVIICLIVFAFMGRYGLYAYIVPKGYRYLPEAGDKIQQISDKDDLIIASAAGGSQGLYFCNRKGWSFLLPGPDEKKTEEAIEKLESLRREGARFFMSAVMDEFNKAALFKEYMFKNYKLIEYQPKKYIIFSLAE